MLQYNNSRSDPKWNINISVITQGKGVYLNQLKNSIARNQIFVYRYQKYDDTAYDNILISELIILSCYLAYKKKIRSTVSCHKDQIM